MSWDDLVCPICKKPLQSEAEAFTCGPCRRRYPLYGEVPDLAPDQEKAEYQFYRDEYQKALALLSNQPIELDRLEKYWYEPSFPETRRILEALGDLQGKRVLVIGGGRNEMLLYLMVKGAELTLTDLAFNGPLLLSQRLRISRLPGQVRFAGVDAYHLPFAEGSFDVVCGIAMVHHLPDLPAFFQEAHRVLKAQGRAVFFDNAYSAIWKWLKQTVFRPFQALSHWRWGISPEDRRATRESGYPDEFLWGLPERTPFASVGFSRMIFLQYLFTRSIYTMLGRNAFCHALARTGAPFFARMDQKLERFPCYRQNTIDLIWWLNKG